MWHFMGVMLSAAGAYNSMRLRTGLQLLRAVRVRAAVTGRDYVIPDDVQALLASVLSHRVLLTSAARLAGRSGADAVTAAAATVALPRSI